MKHLLSIFIVIFLTANSGFAQKNQNYETRIIGGKSYIIYSVKPGDTWASIADKFGITERSLIDGNKQTNGSLKGVSTLKVPMEKSTKSTSSVIIKNTEKEAPVEYNQLPKFGDDIVKQKPVSDKPKIYGQELRTEFRGANSLTVYKIGEGDNIVDLAKYYNCSIDDIKKQNNLVSNTLVTGKILKIPIQSAPSTDAEKETQVENVIPIATPTPAPIIIPKEAAPIITKVKPETKVENKIESKPQEENYVTRTIRGKEYIIYPVKPSDTWKSISIKFSITEQVLKSENIQTNGILKGVSTLKIPKENANEIVYKNKVTEAPVELNKLPKFGENENTKNLIDEKPKIYGKELKTEFRGDKILTIYKVGNGDNIYNLAKYFNSSVSEISSLNNLTNNSISDGKILKILGKTSGTDKPLVDSSKLANNNVTNETDKSESISSQIKGDVSESVSNLKSNETVLGEYLVIKKIGKLYIKHVVISGEDLPRIAKETYTTNSKIISVNNLKTTKITTGQILLIPTNKQTLLKLTGLDFDEVEKRKNEEILSENNNIINASKNINESNNDAVVHSKIDNTNNPKTDSSKRYNWGDPIYVTMDNLDINAKKTALDISKEINAKEIHANANAGETKESYTHSVQVGESIEYIAKKYKISTSDIANWNNLYQNRIRVGQDLIVNLERARKPYLPLNSVSPEMNKQIQNSDKSDRVKYVEEKGLCLFTNEAFIGVAHKNIPVGTLLLLTSTENYKKIYVRVTSILENSNKDVILQVDKTIAKQLAFNSELTNVFLSYALVE